MKYFGPLLGDSVKKRSHRVSLTLALSAFLLLLLSGVPAIAAYAVAEVTPPQDQLVSIDPGHLDVSSEAKTATASFRFPDDSGVADNFIWLAESPTSQQTAPSSTMPRTSGDAKDGIYTATFTIPSTGVPGQWEFRLGALEDINGNNARNECAFRQCQLQDRE